MLLLVKLPKKRKSNKEIPTDRRGFLIAID